MTGRDPVVGIFPGTAPPAERVVRRSHLPVISREVHPDGSHRPAAETASAKPSEAPDGTPYDIAPRTEALTECPRCRGETLRFKELPYGNQWRCDAEGCHYEYYYSLGD